MCMLDCLLVSAIMFYMYKAKIWMGVVTSLQRAAWLAERWPLDIVREGTFLSSSFSEARVLAGGRWAVPGAIAGLHPVAAVIRQQLNMLLFWWFRRRRLTLHGSVPSDEYDNCSSAMLRLPPPDAGCRLVQCITGTPSTTRRRHGGFPLTDVGCCTRHVGLQCCLLPVGRLSSPSAAKNTDTCALLEHRWLAGVAYVMYTAAAAAAALCAPFSSFRFSPVAVITLHHVYCIITL